MTSKSRKKSIFSRWALPLALVTAIAFAFFLGYSIRPPRTSTVPDLVGRSLEEALRVSGELGFSLEVAARRPDERPADTVISQDPGPGSTLGRGLAIKVVVSDGRASDSGVISGDEDDTGDGGDGADKEVHAVVCLDPGHAETPYRIDEETGLNTQDWANEPEIRIVFDIAERARRILEDNGIVVVMTKKGVYDPVDLKKRAVIANEAGALLVLHIHTDPGISSPTTFYPGAGEYGWKANMDSGRKAYIDPEVQRESRRLAAVFHAAMSEYLRSELGVSPGGLLMENRGATGTGNYGPLLTYDVWSKVPTFTLENNQAFADAHRQEVAQGIAEGILACIRDLRKGGGE